MDIKINQTNNTTIDNLDSLKVKSEFDNQLYPSKEALQFIRLELKSYMFRAKEERRYEQQMKSLSTQHDKKLISDEMFKKMKDDITKAYQKIRESELWQYKNKIHSWDLTTLHIIYNHLRRDDRRPHLKNAEVEAEYIAANKSSINKIISTIALESQKLVKKEVVA